MQADDIGGAPDTEPGAIENRLSLNPNDPKWKDSLLKWQDGQSYEVNLRIQQVSPGEFEVMELTSNEPETAEDNPDHPSMPTASEESIAREQSGMNYPNPAVARMMNQR